MASVVEQGPSQFAKILRSSKFASYDPHIGQVYTSYGGHAHRGNYGLKRPITPRRRGLPVTFRSIDSREQQTEWQPAATESRWIKRWEDQPAPRPTKDWLKQVGTSERSWAIDSDFCPAPEPPKIPERHRIHAYTLEAVLAAVKANIIEQQTADALSKGLEPPSLTDEDFGPNGKFRFELDVETAKILSRQRAAAARNINLTMIESINAMTPKEFERHLLQLQKLRPRFAKFIRDRSRALNFIGEVRAKSGELDTAVQFMKRVPDTLFDESTAPDADMVRKLFLAQIAQERYSGATGSLKIQPQPHSAAGVNYTVDAPLLHHYLNKPQPGRYLEVDGRPALGQAVFGGQVVQFDANTRRDYERGRPTFRVVNNELASVPVPGGGLASAKLNTTVTDTDAFSTRNKTRPRPGSRAYVSSTSSSSTPTHTSLLTRRDTINAALNRKRDVQTGDESTKPIMNTLSHLMKELDSATSKGEGNENNSDER